MKQKIFFLMILLMPVLWGYSQSSCPAPTGLNATMHTPDWHNVQLQWNAAESDAAPTDLLWSTREGSYNLGTGSDFTGVVRFEPSDLTSVAGQVLSSVSFIPAASACTYSIKVWQGGNFNNATFTPGTLIVDQEITSQLSLWNLNTIALNTPIAIDTTQELWIGIDCITSSSQVLGLSGNGAVANKGEILFWNGGWSTVTEVSGLSANWVIIGSFTDPNNTPSGYNVYRDYVQLNTTPITGTNYIDTVAAGTYIYDVTAVYPNGCESDSITTTVTMVDNPCANCTDSITIGSGELTGHTIPLHNYYNYSYTQQIYTASEIGNSAGLINCIAFQYVNPSSQTKNIEVYLGNTNKTSFSNDYDFISINNMQLCYEGPWSLIAREGDNWINIPFSTPFEWDGTSNIVIAIVNNTGTFESDDATFVYDTTETHTTLLAFSDYYPYNVETTVPTDGERLQERNNVRFLMGGEISCWTPMGLTVSDLTSSGATISWTGHDTDAGYEVVVVPAGGDVNLGTTESISDTFYIVTGCAGNTEYDVYVRAICADGNSNWVMTTIHTTCQYLETLPYTENFDLYDDGAGNTPDCWFINSDPTTPPYISSLHHASGSNSLFLEDAAGRHSCAILPAISTDFYSINTLQVSFKALKTFDSFGHLIVGVMSDPTNMSTFTPVKTFDGPMYSGSNVWNEFTVYFNTYEGMGTHIAFYAPGDYTSEVYIDDVEVKLITGCATPRDFDTEHVSGSSVYLTWNEGEYVDESVVYNIEYTVQGEENWQMADTPTGTNCLITGLTPGTTYDAMLYVTCSNGYSDTLTLSFTTGCLANADVTIGTVNENDYSSYIPLKTNEKYYISQQLFTAAEMGDSNTLYGLKLNVIRTGGQPTREVDIYLGNTTLSSLSTYNSVSGHTKVFSGTIDISSTGWTEIAFDSAFAYTGNNLLLTIDDNTGNYIGSGCRFAVHTQTNGSLYAIDYSSDINPISNAASFNPRNQRSSIIFVGECDTTAVVCATPTLFISNVTPNGAEMFWAPGYTETEWELDYKRAVDSTWTSEGIIYQNSHILTNLEVSTEYDVRLRSICGTDEYSDYTDVMSFETPCSYISELPFTENFDSVAINTIPVCWSEMHNNPTAVPQVSNAQSFIAGGNSLHLDNGGTFYTSIVCTPHIADEFAMNNLKISFFTYGGTTDEILEVGIMADPETPSTFYSLGTISPVSINTWESHEFFTNEYTGNGRYIAFKVPMGRINEIYVDELTIDAIPNCSRVENLTLTAVDSTSATFSWTPGSTESQWEYVILPAGHVNLDTVQNLNVTFSEFHTEYDLQHTTDYTFYIRAICNSGENSDWAHLDFSTRQNPAQLPYICDFESANPGWEFYNEPNTNQWVIGNAVNNGGSKALYISKNDGNSHSYGGYISDNWAYRDIYFPASEDGYIISFDWKANGEADDYMNVFIGDPIDIDSANHILTGEGFAGLEKMNNDTMHLQESFTNFNYILAGYATASVKRIYFAWHNDLFVQHDPPAAIDNFMVSEISCPIPSALTVNNITATTADLTWTETGTASEWVVSYKPSSSTTWTTVPVFATSYQLTDLTPEVTYTVHVAAVCDADGTLSPISNTVQFSTPASCPVPTNLTCTGHTSTTIDLSWSAGDAESMWIVSYKTEGSDWSTAIEANAVDTTYTITNVTFATPYIIRVKAACSTTSESVWSDSIVVIPGSHIMSATGSASITTCGTIIYDDGGLGDYSNGANSVLTIYPENPGEFVVISGTSTTEYNHDFIYVYDGEGTYGELLNTYTGTGRAILDTSITGPITIHFSADATMHYAGFEITTSCSTVGADDGEEEQDPCIAPTNVNVTADITTADVTWTAGGTETTWVVEYMLATADYWSSSDSLSTTSYQITGLTASTDYFVRVKAICSQDNESEWSDTVSFTTLDEVIPTYTITATAMGPGTITPEGTFTVDEGSDITFTFTADEGAIVSQLLVDEMETAIPENNEYTFSAIVANHTIAVTFEEDGDDTGIDDVNLDNTVLLFPNPATSYIEIRLQNNALNNATMEIYDVYGRKVATQTMNNNSLQVNISDYSAGMYLVRIFNENGVVVKNFIKK